MAQQIFDELRISLASSDQIRAWSYGEVKKPETINYRTLRPEKEGLFDERIFGPQRDWECYCGKYKRIRYKGIICERCGVEVTRAKVRRERMGHIELAAPVTHIWFFKGVPSRLGYMLDMSPKELEKVIYFASYIITSVDDERRQKDLPELEQAMREEIEVVRAEFSDWHENRLEMLEDELARMEEGGAKPQEINARRKEVEREIKDRQDRSEREVELIEEAFDTFRTLAPKQLVESEQLWREIWFRYADYFEGGMGAEAIKALLGTLDLDAEMERLEADLNGTSQQKRQRATQRMKVVKPFWEGKNRPVDMILETIPVIPPELRPMVQLDGGRFATSDLNDLYRRVINRNNRLKRLLDLGAPEIIVNNEKRMLQEAVDALFDNGRRGRPVTGPGNRPLKSISDMLKGKQGRFRQNLLGKRVDYSGRSVIVVGPQLKLHQCGLPKQMALELFKPFVMKRLVELNHAQNIKSAKRMVERSRPEVWDVLEEVITEHPVLLNRAPTLHRLGIQAFEPQLVEGKAIHLHPLVCAAFNADFDGDQMAVHLPLSAEAQAEARILMLSSNNILKPSDGRPVTMPTQDMVIGLYHLSLLKEGDKGEGLSFSSVAEARMAFDAGEISLNARIKLRVDGDTVPPNGHVLSEDHVEGTPYTLTTTLGRALFNELLPVSLPYVESDVDKKVLGSIVNELAERYPKVEVAASLDALKEAGFYWATRSGVTIAISDVAIPADKQQILERFEGLALNIDEQFETGLITRDERRQELIEIWTQATNEVDASMRASFPDHNTVHTMVTSGARGSWQQVRQIAGMRGLVTNPKGEIIPRPIKANYREGLSVLEYFIATHGARKGLADTALRTADSGYLTRRLVDVSQDVIVREADCGTERGLSMPIIEPGSDKVKHERVETSVFARTLATDVTNAKDDVIGTAGADIGDVLIDALIAEGIEEVKVRSVLTCESAIGTCAQCYGRSLATRELVDIGEAVGIIAAQSIGEPGTQLTMRTFHTGGVVTADDITQGLPRVQELFEARTPKGEAPISEVAGRLKVDDSEATRRLVVTPDNGDDPFEYPVTKRSRLLVQDGEQVEVGQQLVAGAVDPKSVLRILGPRATQKHLVDEVQEVYRSQGVEIHDKHIEVIVRQMLRRVTVLEAGDAPLLPGELAERARFEQANRETVTKGGKPASARPELMGITKASLATESWLSAASFQETTRVLTEAAMSRKSDPLVGLKENVILGKLIPAGTGLQQYGNATVDPTEEAKSNLFPTFGYEEWDGQYFSEGTGQAVRLEEFDFPRE